MKNYKKIIIIILNIFILCISKITFATPLKVVIVESYTLEQKCGTPQTKGIIDTLYKKYGTKNISIREYLMLVRSKNKTHERKTIIAKKIIKKILKIKPDYIFVVDDAAFNYVGIPLAIKYNKTIYFTGINKPFSYYVANHPTLKEKNVFGVEEVVDFKFLFKFFDLNGIKLQKIYVIYNINNNFVFYLCKNIRNSLLKYFNIEEISVTNSFELKNTVNEINKHNNCGIVLLTLSLEDIYLYSVAADLTYKLINNNNILIVINSYVKGYDIAITTDFYNMGVMCATIALNEEKTIKQSKTIVKINTDSLLKKGYEVMGLIE